MFNYFHDIKTNDVKKVRVGAVISLVLLIGSFFIQSPTTHGILFYFCVSFLLLTLLKEARNKENGVFLLLKAYVPQREPRQRVSRQRQRDSEEGEEEERPRQRETRPRFSLPIGNRNQQRSQVHREQRQNVFRNQERSLPQQPRKISPPPNRSEEERQQSRPPVSQRVPTRTPPPRLFSSPVSPSNQQQPQQSVKRQPPKL